jgi:hypothetical protein
MENTDTDKTLSSKFEADLVTPNPYLASLTPSLASQSVSLSSNLQALAANPNWKVLPLALQNLVVGLDQRTTPDKVRDALIQLYAYRPWQAPELASLFNRNAAYLATQYLRPLVNAKVRKNK